jgi:hypothetical protein
MPAMIWQRIEIRPDKDERRVLEFVERDFRGEVERGMAGGKAIVDPYLFLRLMEPQRGGRV